MSRETAGRQSFSPLASPRATRDALDYYGLAPKYRYGQNFLINDGVVGHILEFAELTPADRVLEIGPGIGTLTSALLRQAGHVTVLEMDSDLVGILPEILGGVVPLDQENLAKRFCVVHGVAVDLIKQGGEHFNLTQHVSFGALPPELPTKLVANLPYAVAATVVLDILQMLPSIERIVVMVQAEVADRMTASVGTKTYGAYTAKMQLFTRFIDRFNVKPQNFLPAPRVNSAVVCFDRNQTPATSEFLSFTCQVIDAAFAQRRKTLRNSMSSQGWEKQRIDEACEAIGIDPYLRGEALTVEDYQELARELLLTCN